MYKQAIGLAPRPCEFCGQMIEPTRKNQKGHFKCAREARQKRYWRAKLLPEFLFQVRCKTMSKKSEVTEKIVKRISNGEMVPEFMADLHRLPLNTLEWIDAGLDAAIEAGRVQGNEEYASFIFIP